MNDQLERRLLRRYGEGFSARVPDSLLPAAFGLATAAAAFTVGRYIQRERSRAAQERESLRAATESLKHRNNQLTALYNVFSEITETLSLRYVVDATLRETLRLMDAQGAVVWLIRGGELVPAGGLTIAGKPIKGLEPQELGEGLMGRTTRRGRTLRIDDSNRDLLSEAQQAHGLRSGILVPLIVGARVVGLLNCWSVQPDAFDDEDQRILEMMASQVATAVVAADATETSERRAHRDPLTGLPNRLQLTDDLEGELSPRSLGNRRLVVAMIDIDHFKRFNDDYGHSVGDVTLQKVASVLQNCIRENDRIYRYGGEEFVIVLLDVSQEEAQALAERLRKAVESTPFSGSNLEPVGPVTISLGLASGLEQRPNVEQLINLADSAMYRAKTQGRNRVALWDSEQHALTTSTSESKLDPNRRTRKRRDTAA